MESKLVGNTLPINIEESELEDESELVGFVLPIHLDEFELE